MGEWIGWPIVLEIIDFKAVDKLLKATIYYLSGSGLNMAVKKRSTGGS